MKNVILTLFIAGLILISQNLYAQINIDSGCVANYPFSGNANDISGNGNHGTVYGATLTFDRYGDSNSAYSFSGTNNYISVPNDSTLNFGTITSFSVCAWIICSANQPNYAGIVVKADPSGPVYGYQFCIVNNRLACELMWGGSPIGIFGNTVINDSTWKFVTLVINRVTNNVKLYIDGVIDKDYTNSILSGKNLNCTANMYIGKDRYAACYNGILDDIRIYNRTLSQVEILALYNILPSPTLLSPTNGSTGITLTPTLFWNTVSNATAYTVQVSPLSNFSLIVDSATVTTNQRTIPAGKLNVASTYFWRVRGVNSYGYGPWSNVWSFSTLLTGIQILNSEFPDEYKLYSNYPNPFNPVTNIKFDLPKSSFTNISVYNILGEEVDVVVNKNLSAGSYKITWDASNFTSGVYFCKLTTGDYADVIRMVLLK